MTLGRIRYWHSYIGLFIGPSVRFFVLTGAMQIFDLQRPRGNYRPPSLIEKLSSVHRDQVFTQPHRDRLIRQGSGQATLGDGIPGPQHPPDDEKSRLPTLLLKCFFFLVALGLAITTPLGIWMGLTQTRRKPLAWILFAAGAVIPIALLIA